MTNKIIDYIKNNKVAINCENEGDYKKLTLFLHENGEIWASGLSFSERNNYREYKEETCIIFSDMQRWIYDRKWIYNNDTNFTVITVSELFKMFEEKVEKKTITPQEALSRVNTKWKWICKNKDNTISIFDKKPSASEYESSWIFSSECRRFQQGLFQEEIIFENEDWKECIVERPIDFNKYIGRHGLFADNLCDLNIYDAQIGSLESIGSDGEYYDNSNKDWKHFRPLTQEEIELLTYKGE